MSPFLRRMASDLVHLPGAASACYVLDALLRTWLASEAPTVDVLPVLVLAAYGLACAFHQLVRGDDWVWSEPSTSNEVDPAS